jgi:hypothetical protein
MQDGEEALMRARAIVGVVAGLAIAASALFSPNAPAGAQQAEDFPIPNGWFYTQTRGSAPLGHGFAVQDSDVAMWSAFAQMGGPAVMGYPVSQRYLAAGRVTQAFQRATLVWRADGSNVDLLGPVAAGSLTTEASTPVLWTGPMGSPQSGPPPGAAGPGYGPSQPGYPYGPGYPYQPGPSYPYAPGPAYPYAPGPAYPYAPGPGYGPPQSNPYGPQCDPAYYPYGCPPNPNPAPAATATPVPASHEEEEDDHHHHHTPTPHPPQPTWTPRPASPTPHHPAATPTHTHSQAAAPVSTPTPRPPAQQSGSPNATNTPLRR